MNYSISLTKRTNGGYTVVYDGVTSYPSHIQYHGTEDGKARGIINCRINGEHRQIRIAE